jgi:hypothetical protein
VLACIINIELTTILTFLGTDEKWCILWERARCRKCKNHKLNPNRNAQKIILVNSQAIYEHFAINNSHKLKIYSIMMPVHLSDTKPMKSAAKDKHIFIAQQLCAKP